MTITVLPKGVKFIRMEYAGRFNLPPEAIVVHAGLIEELKKGDFVKVTVCNGDGGSEKFWCKFEVYDPVKDLMYITVANDLVYGLFHGLYDEQQLVVPAEFLCAAIKV